METTVLHYLERSAERLPEKTAFADTDKEIAYGQLLEQARRLGSALALLAAPTQPVPVYMEKSVDAVTAFMGIIAAGCCYVMLDRRQPAARQEQILGTLETDVLLTTRQYLQEAEELPFKGKLLVLEDLLCRPADEALLQARREQALDTDPLYINFTSGSTGIPKGVVVGHRSVMDFIDNFAELFEIREDDVIGNQAPFDFDVSVKDIYSTLRQGATMQIIPTRYFSIPRDLLDFLEERGVTTLIWAVSALCLVSQLHGFTYRVPSRIRQVIFSGEVMPVKQLNIWREALPDVRYVNVYGPTEITCNCTYYIVDRHFEPGETLPMGRAFPNERVFLLDEEDHLVTGDMPGKEGEICVGGSALALGYYRRPDLTEKVFVQNPLHDRYTDRIYRTGDLAYYDEKGELYFRGRRDLQIKHMGHRIELGEVEKALDALPEIKRACCLFVKNRITACYTGTIEKKELAAELGKTLPPYMIPGRFVHLDSLPVTRNGKIDRRALENELGAVGPAAQKKKMPD